MAPFRVGRGFLTRQAMECFRVLYRPSPRAPNVSYYVPLLPGQNWSLFLSVAMLTTNTLFLYISHYLIHFLKPLEISILFDPTCKIKVS